MANRIRRGTLVVGSAVSNVANFEWTDADDVDRSKGDLEMSGKPIVMRQAGSGSFTLLAGSVASGYATSDPVFSYKEIALSSGVESPTTKTVTFTKVTFNQGGSVPAEGRGEKRISFDYATATQD
jgi:hypothetical protein